MTIKVGDNYWSNEGGNTWHQVPESAISYGIWTCEPSADRIAAINADLDAAHNADSAASPKTTPATTEEMFSVLVSMPTPRVDAIKATAEYQAMAAYRHFRLCELESNA